MKKLIYLLFVLPLFFSCGGPSACDCADWFGHEDNPSNIDYSPEEYNDGTMDDDVENFIEFTRDCALKYGNLSEFEKEMVKGATNTAQMGIYKFQENAKKECK